MVYLIVAFKLKNITLEQQVLRSREHVSNVAGSPGLHWKLWLGDGDSGEYVGFYEFETRQDAEAYMQPGGGGAGLFGLNKSPIIAREVSYQIYDCFRYQRKAPTGFWQLDEFQNLAPEGGSFEPDWIFTEAATP